MGAGRTSGHSAIAAETRGALAGSELPQLTAAQRRWSLAAAIGSVAVFGLGIGQLMPLLSLLLERRGFDAALNGLNSAAAFLGVIVGPLLAPRAARALGIRNFLIVCFAIDIAGVALLKIFDGFAAWLVFRVLLGLVGSSIFTTSEAWINLLAEDAVRGRVIGLYAAALAAGFGSGPLLLSLTGIEGWPPFLAAIAISAVAALPWLGVGKLASGIGRGHGRSLLTLLAQSPLLLFAVTIFGMYETTLMVLLPIWGVRTGLPEGFAAATVSAVNFGAIALQLPIGWLSDKLPRITVLRLCGTVGLLGALAAGASAGRLWLLYGVLFVWGGVAAGIYPVALGMAGEQFRGADLLGINAAVVIAYGAGSLVGPAFGGAAMNVWNPNGLPALLAVMFGLLLTLASWAPPRLARQRASS